MTTAYDITRLHRISENKLARRPLGTRKDQRLRDFEMKKHVAETYGGLEELL